MCSASRSPRRDEVLLPTPPTGALCRSGALSGRESDLERVVHVLARESDWILIGVWLCSLASTEAAGSIAGGWY
jgi:hypothetical protein